MAARSASGAPRRSASSISKETSLSRAGGEISMAELTHEELQHIDSEISRLLASDNDMKIWQRLVFRDAKDILRRLKEKAAKTGEEK